MKHLNSFDGVMTDKNPLETMQCPTLYDKPIEGVFIEATDGTLVKTEDWDGTKTANSIYVSDGYRKVRLSLTWCNDTNCEATHASSNGEWDGLSGNSNYTDDGNGITVYGNDNAKSYRWFVGKFNNYQFNNGVKIDCLSYGKSWDWDGKTVTETIMNDDELKEHFPAMKAAYTYINPKGEKGYLMGISELQMVFAYQTQVNAALTKCGGVAFDYESSTNSLWSCSCNYTNYVWCLNTNLYGYLNYFSADYYYAVRPAF